MCDIIQIENVISNYFTLNLQKEDVDFKTLYKYKNRIEKKFSEQNKCVFIDFSNASLINTAIHNSEFFTITNDKIIYKPKDNKEKLLEGIGVYFNAKIPYRIKNDFLAIMKEVNTELNPEYESVC